MERNSRWFTRLGEGKDDTNRGNLVSRGWFPETTPKSKSWAGTRTLRKIKRINDDHF